MVVVEVLTGYTQVAPFKTTKQEETIPALRRILQKFKSVMKLKGSKLQSDGGVEYKSSQADVGYRNAFTEMVNAEFGMTYVQTAKRTCVHVESRNKDIRTAVNSRLAASGSKSWITIYEPIIKQINETPATDDRAPHSPAQMVKFSPKKQKQLFFSHRKAKQDRNSKRQGAKINIKVGDWVRVALETKAKGETMQKKGPE